MDSDGLIKADPAMTWMDARVDGRPVTPRAGKACEINALWYDDLKIMEAFAQLLGCALQFRAFRAREGELPEILEQRNGLPIRYNRS